MTGLDFGPPAFTDAEIAEYGADVEIDHNQSDRPRTSGVDQADEALIGGVLAAACCGDRLPAAVHQVEPEWFTVRGHAVVWQAIHDCIECGVSPDLVTVVTKLRAWNEPDCASLAVELCDGGLTVNIEQWMKIVAEAARKRRLKTDLEEAVARAGAGAGVDDISTTVTDAVGRATVELTSGGLRTVRSVLTEAMAELDRRCLDPAGGRLLCTGLRDLDEMLELGRGQLTVLAGRPSMGKTALAGNIADSVASERDKPGVAFFSLEMSAVAVILRMMARRAGIDERRFIFLMQQGRGAVVAKAAAEVCDLNLYVDDRSGISVSDMATALVKIQRPRLVVVDYLGLARLNAKLERQDLRIGAVTKELKKLSKDFECQVLALCQLNRDTEKQPNRMPTLANLRDSGNIEEDADNVVFVNRPGKDNNDIEDDHALISVAKQRGGRTGTVKVGWRGETKEFMDYRGTES